MEIFAEQNTQSEVLHPWSNLFFAVKRCFDIVAVLGAGILLAIPMIFIALLIRLDSPGPVIFCQERLGKDGRPFIMYKFRTMIPDAEPDGPQMACTNDPRYTRLGGFLRRSRLDELPQLLNIFLGDMSFVGPRPERAHFYGIFETYIPNFRARLAVKPGLTGLAQVHGGYDLRPEEKLVYDMAYIRNMSILLDIYCLCKTVRLIFTQEGAR